MPPQQLRNPKPTEHEFSQGCNWAAFTFAGLIKALFQYKGNFTIKFLGQKIREESEIFYKYSWEYKGFNLILSLKKIKRLFNELSFRQLLQITSTREEHQVNSTSCLSSIVALPACWIRLLSHKFAAFKNRGQGFQRQDEQISVQMAPPQLTATSVVNLTFINQWFSAVAMWPRNFCPRRRTM